MPSIFSLNRMMGRMSMKSAALKFNSEGIGLALLKIAPASLSIKPVQGVNGIYNEMGLAAWEDELYFTSIATQRPLEIDEGHYSSICRMKGKMLWWMA